MISILKKMKNKLLIFILLISLFSIPTSVFAYSNKVILGGDNIGIQANSKGVMIVGFYNVKSSSPGLNAGLKKGDILLKVDDTDISKISDLSNRFSNSNNLKITYMRNKKIQTTNIKLKKDEGVYKTGLYIKDSISGIGTLTFIDPSNKRFGALGHEILEQSTGVRFEIKDGEIFSSDVTNIEKGDKKEVGEKNAIFDRNKIFGRIDKNKKTGIYGDYIYKLDSNNLINISDDVKLGKAQIRTVVKGKKKELFDINILEFDKSAKTKNILFEVIDNKLLKNSNGIVQGMSGSPIIQNNKLIGAVTHVVVDDTHKGYGILIKNMLKESE